MHYFSFLLLLASSPLATANGWWLDQSCDRLPNKGKIVNVIAQSFELASDVYSSKFPRENAKVPWDDDDNRLYKLLIGSDNDISEVEKSYKGVGALSVKENNKDDAFLKIYCDLSRLKEVIVQGEETLKDKLDKRAYEKAKAGCADKKTLAWTDAKRDKSNNDIQLCPGFVENIKNRYVEYKTLQKAWIGVNKLLGARTTFTSVDMLAYPYTTMFHELMHTNQGLRRDDTEGDEGSYHWHNVVKIGEKGSAYKNADNLMYFALAMKLKKDNLIVQNDGSIKKRS